MTWCNQRVDAEQPTSLWLTEPIQNKVKIWDVSHMVDIATLIDYVATSTV